MGRIRNITVFAVLTIAVVGVALATGVLAVAPGAKASGNGASAAMVASTAKPVASSAKTSEESALSDEAAKRLTDRETRQAIAVLGKLEKQYKHLEDVSVIVGQTPKGEEAVAYYTDGEIIIDAEHSVEIEKILAHEIWHVIDYRDNGEIDWGEDLPPNNSSDYLK